MRTLLKNCILVSPDMPEMRNAYLGIDQDTICYIGTEKPKEEYDTQKDMKGAIITPGFVNCHNHTSMVLLRGIGNGLNLQSWLFDVIFPLEDKLTHQAIREGTSLAILEMLASGTTSYSDMYFFPRESVEIVNACGIKANLARSIQEFDPLALPENNYEINESVQLFKDWHNKANGRIRIDFSIHAEYTNQANTVRYYSEICKSHRGRMHIHMAETKKETEQCIAKYGKTPVEWFASLGTFDSPTAAAHCVYVTEKDMEIMSHYGVMPIYNPTSNMKLGSGFAPVREMLQRGIPVALGTDGAATNNNLNMLEEMHLASLLTNGYCQDSTALHANEVLRMATKNGALLQGRTDTGSLEVGKKADLCAISTDSPHMIPNHDSLPLVVYSAQASDVIMTMVDGKILYENGEYTTMDKDKIIWEAKEAAKKLVSKT